MAQGAGNIEVQFHNIGRFSILVGKQPASELGNQLPTPMRRRCMLRFEVWDESEAIPNRRYRHCIQSNADKKKIPCPMTMQNKPQSCPPHRPAVRIWPVPIITCIGVALVWGIQVAGRRFTDLNDDESNNGQPKFYRRPTIWWVVSMVICVFATFLTSGRSGPPNLIITFFVSSCVALFASIGVWLAVGVRWWRIPVQLFASLIVVLLLIQDGPGRFEDFLLMCLFGVLVIGVVAVPIFLYRMLKNGTLAKPSWHEAGVKEVLQFNVIHLLALMTGVAVLISLGQWLFPLLSDNGGGSISIVCTLGVTLSLGSLVAVWATLGNHPGLRTVVSALVIAVIAGLNYALIERTSFGWFYVVLTIIAWIQFTALMWCIRFEGFRFIIRPRTSSK